MDSWLKSKAEELAQAAQAAQHHVTGLQEKLLQGISTSEGKKDLEFEPGPLGFILEGALVVNVAEGSQAETLGVEVGDRLVEIAGYEVPYFTPGDVHEEQRANKLIKKWLKEMPRPGRLTFALPQSMAEPADAGAEVMSVELPLTDSPRSSQHIATSSDEAVHVAVGSTEPAKAVHVAVGSTELAKERVLQAQEEERRLLTSDLQEARQALEAEKRKGVKLLEELGIVRARNKELLRAANSREADNDSAMEAAEQRERALEEEVDRLRKGLGDMDASEARERALEEEVAQLRTGLEAAAQRATTLEAQLGEVQVANDQLSGSLEAATSRASVAEARALAAENSGATMAKELQGFREAHDAELNLLRDDHSKEAERLRERWEEQERNAAVEFDKLRQELAEQRRAADEQRAAVEAATGEAQAAVVEAAAARTAARAATEELALARAAAAKAASSTSAANVELGDDDVEAAEARRVVPIATTPTEEVSELYDRIDLLEKRCVTLQKKLNTQVLNTQGQAGVGQSHPVWLPWVTSVAGPQAGQLSVLAYRVPDKALRNFTQRLQKNDMWRWMFYAHLLFLYTMAASCYVQTAPDAGNPVDTINKKLAGMP